MNAMHKLFFWTKCMQCGKELEIKFHNLNFLDVLRLVLNFRL
jgi:hypothetical protein